MEQLELPFKEFKKIPWREYPGDPLKTLSPEEMAKIDFDSDPIIWDFPERPIRHKLFPFF